jgi:hypothetical protein
MCAREEKNEPREEEKEKKKIKGEKLSRSKKKE